MSLGGEGLVEGQIGGQGQDPGQPARVSKALVERNGTALREAREHHVIRAHAALLLPRDERAHLGPRLTDAPGILGHAAVEGEDVVPGAHPVAAVDGDGPDLGVGEHEANGQGLGQPQLRHQRLEVVAVRAEPV